MQQRCTTCGAPIQPGNVVCTNCGTPVSSGASGSYGAGSYDPTIRAGTPPNTGYGSPSYGAPPPSPGFGSQPYGAPQPNFGAPPPPVYPVMQPPQKSRRGLFYALGGIGVLVVILLVVCIVLGGVLGGKFSQQVTTGTHITKLQTGTGFDENTGAVTGETDTFHVGDTVHIVFTVTNAGANTVLIVKMYAGSDLEHTSSPESIDSGTNVYDYSYTGPAQTGSYKAEIDYNGAQDGTITFNVTS